MGLEFEKCCLMMEGLYLALVMEVLEYWWLAFTTLWNMKIGVGVYDYPILIMLASPSMLSCCWRFGRFCPVMLGKFLKLECSDYYICCLLAYLNSCSLCQCLYGIHLFVVGINKIKLITATACYRLWFCFCILAFYHLTKIMTYMCFPPVGESRCVFFIARKLLILAEKGKFFFKSI